MIKRATRQRQRAVVLMSGGIDSMACAHFLPKEANLRVTSLFVDYGQAPRIQERRAAGAVAARFRIQLSSVRVSAKRRHGAGELPGRNLFFASVALLVTDPKPDMIALGIHAGTRYYDCSHRFAERLRQLMEEQTDGLAPHLNGRDRSTA